MSRFRGDDGNAVVEFTWLAVLLMVPVVYVLVGLFQVQRAAFGVTEAARQAGRALARADDCASGMARARTAAGLAMSDQGIASGWTMPTPTGCPLVAGEPVTVRVAYVVHLPAGRRPVRRRPRRDPGAGDPHRGGRPVPRVTRLRGDDGSVMLLVLGFAVVLVALLGVVTDVSVLLLAKRGVASAADGAAVAGAQQLDREAFYSRGLGAAVPLDSAAVASAVGAYERVVEPRTALDSEVSGDGRTVRVRASRRVPLPFARYAGIGAVTVRAVASARAPVLD